MNVLLHVAVTDITGQTGLKIVRSILAGERAPERLAAHRDPRCHASHAEIMAALTGNYRAEHLFALKQNFAAYEFLRPISRELCAVSLGGWTGHGLGLRVNACIHKISCELEL